MKTITKETKRKAKTEIGGREKVPPTITKKQELSVISFQTLGSKSWFPYLSYC